MPLTIYKRETTNRDTDYSQSITLSTGKFCLPNKPHARYVSGWCFCMSAAGEMPFTGMKTVCRSQRSITNVTNSPWIPLIALFCQLMGDEIGSHIPRGPHMTFFVFYSILHNSKFACNRQALLVIKARITKTLQVSYPSAVFDFRICNHRRSFC